MPPLPEGRLVQLLVSGYRLWYPRLEFQESSKIRKRRHARGGLSSLSFLVVTETGVPPLPWASQGKGLLGARERGKYVHTKAPNRHLEVPTTPRH